MTEYFGTPLQPNVVRHQKQVWAMKHPGPIARRLEAIWREETKDEPKPTKEERYEWHPPQCANCGHFTSWLSDSYTPYGSGFEPPDDEYLCDRCVAIEICDAMNAGRLWSHWHSMYWEKYAAELLGFVRKDGHWEKADAA